MNQNPGIIGKKIGMTQIFDDKGEVIRVTVVQGGCVVLGKRTIEKDKYSALILGLGERKEKNVKKPVLGFLKKAGQTPKRWTRELRASAEHVAKFEIGQKLPLDQIFEAGQIVDAQGTSRGRGFTGVMRRWSFAGGVGSHGTHEYFRHGGSIGTNMTPGRTLPNVKMPGFRWLTPGSLVAVVAWIAASAAFAFYVANFGSYDKIYGSLGAIVTLLIWVWISNLALLFGMELNAERERSRELDAGVPRADKEIQLEPRAEPGTKRTT